MNNTVFNTDSYTQKIVWVSVISFVIADIVPTPADALYFHWQQTLKAKLNAKQITPKQYWLKDAANYYSLNPLWWGVVGGIILSTKGTLKHKLHVALGLVAAGAVVGVIANNIKKDQKLLEDQAILDKQKSNGTT